MGPSNPDTIVDRGRAAPDEAGPYCPTPGGTKKPNMGYPRTRGCLRGGRLRVAYTMRVRLQVVSGFRGRARLQLQSVFRVSIRRRQPGFRSLGCRRSLRLYPTIWRAAPRGQKPVILVSKRALLYGSEFGQCAEHLSNGSNSYITEVGLWYYSTK